MHLALGLLVVASLTAFIGIAENVATGREIATFDTAFARGLRSQLSRAWYSLFWYLRWLGSAPVAFDIGQGGWETRLLGIFGRTLGPKLGRDTDPDKLKTGPYIPVRDLRTENRNLTIAGKGQELKVTLHLRPFAVKTIAAKIRASCRASSSNTAAR